MKKYLSIIFSVVLVMCFVSCSKCCKTKAIELMGAGDRIHDTFTFANNGVEIKEIEENIFEISGSVEKLDNEEIKNEFNVDDDIDYVVAIKLSALGKKVNKKKVSIDIDGVRNFDAEHFNGTNYTFIILETIPGDSVSINVSWNGEDEDNYIIKFDNNLQLK